MGPSSWVFLLVGMGGWYSSQPWMHDDLLEPMMAVLIVVGIIGGLLVWAGCSAS